MYRSNNIHIQHTCDLPISGVRYYLFSQKFRKIKLEVVCLLQLSDNQQQNNHIIVTNQNSIQQEQQQQQQQLRTQIASKYLYINFLMNYILEHHKKERDDVGKIL